MNYNEYWVDEPTSDYVHISELDDIEQAKEFLSEAFDGIYGEKSLDHMERALEEACSYLDIPLPNKELTIEKKNQQKTTFYT